MIFLITPFENDTTYEPLFLRDISQSETPYGESRMTRSKLIDGGVYIEKRGAAHGDRDISIRGNVSEAQAEALEYFWYNQVNIALSIPEQLLIGYVKSMNITGGDMSLTFWPEGDEAEVHDKFKADM